MSSPYDPHRAEHEPVMAQAVSNQPPHYAPPPRRGGVGRWIGALLVLLMVGMVGFVMLAMIGVVAMAIGTPQDEIEERFHSGDEHASNKIAIITVDGAILEGAGGFVKKQIDRVREDDDVKAIVLRVDSPGGTVTASDYILHHLKELKDDRELPLVVSMGGMAASGGYYVAMAVEDEPDSIFAEPTSWTGSIGVIIPHYNFEGLMAHWEIEDDSIASHHLKDMGSPFKKMTPEEREIFQGLVDDSFDRFKEIVKTGRPKYREKPELLDAVATGQVFATSKAIESGLVDKEGFIEAAIERAAELANVDPDNVRIVDYKEPVTLASLLGASAQARATPFDVQTLVELTSPRAYYLCTWAPPLEP